MRILIVEDDGDLAELMALNLEAQGYTVDVCREGDDGLRMMRERAHDLVLLDRMLPRLDGLAVLQAARREKINTPVLMVTALGSLAQKVEGLDGGADDYIEKPFALDELLARVRAMSRRPRGIMQPDAVSHGDVRLETIDKRLIFREQQCSLSKRETDLLEILLKNVGKTIPRATLFAYVWGADAPVENGNLDNYIHYVRDRLREVGCGLAVHTVRGVGYRMEEQGNKGIKGNGNV